MRRLAPLLLLLLLPASAHAADPEEVGRGLRSDPVYVDARANPSLSVRDAGRVRLRIASRAIGRNKVAVLSRRAADRAGGLQPLANAVDRGLGGIRGTLIVSAGPGLHLVTSYRDSERAVRAVRSAVSAHEDDRLAVKLLDAVDRLARADPGPAQDLQAPVAPRITIPAVPAIPDARGVSDDVVGTFKVVVYTVLALIALPFVILGLVLWRRARRRRAEEAEQLGEDREAAREQLIALGDEIRALDLDVSMPNADPAGRADYERALGCYERADRALAEADGRRRLDRATGLLGEGLKAIEAAKARLGGAERLGPPAGGG